MVTLEELSGLKLVSLEQTRRRVAVFGIPKRLRLPRHSLLYLSWRGIDWKSSDDLPVAVVVHYDQLEL
jgi:hypothetical protein